MKIATRNDAFTDLDQTVLNELASVFRGPLLSSEDADYEKARVVFNGVFDKRPALIAQCTGTADVMDAVRFARRHDLLVAVRGGGHSIAGKSSCDGGLVIDLPPMRGVQVDPEKRIARVQGGATWGDVDRETQAFGLVAPGGVVSHTGVAGLTLNGGIGWVRNKYGLSCDNLIGAEVVTAEGNRVYTSEEVEPELLWGLRGGGGNFGIVTSFEFSLHPVGPTVAVSFPFYPMEDAGGLMRRWRDWMKEAPDEVTSEFVLWTAPATSDLPPEVHGKQVAIPAAVYCGAPEEGERVLETNRHWGEPLAEIAGPMPFCAVQRAFDIHFPNTGEVLAYWKSSFFDELGDAAIDLIVQQAAERSSPRTLIGVNHMGGAVQRVPRGACAHAGRDTFEHHIVGTWNDPAESEMHIAWVRDAWSQLQPHSTGRVYLNFLGQDGEDARDLVRSAFGGNFDRLVALKRKYDPDNIFRLNQNIEPGGSEPVRMVR